MDPAGAPERRLLDGPPPLPLPRLELPKILQRIIRADSDPVPEFIIEVKRASTTKGLIDVDLQRLVAARRLCPDTRAFCLSFPKQIGLEDLFSRRDIPSEESIRYQSPTAIRE